MLSLASPYPFFTDKAGDPLDGGYVYVGEVNQNPETAPVVAYWDEAGTQPAAQPLRTLAGHIVRNGTPARVYVEGDDFSMTVKDKRGVVLFYERSVAAASSLRDDLADDTSPAKGAGMVGADFGIDYPDQTVGFLIKIANEPVNVMKAFSKAEGGAIRAKTSSESHQAQIADVLQNEKAVWFPYGKFNVSGAISLGSHNVCIYGHKDAQISVADGSYTFLRYSGAQRFEVRGLKLWGTNNANPGVTLLAVDSGSAYFMIDGVEFAYAAKNLLIDGCYIGKVRDVMHSNADVYMEFDDNTGSSADISVVRATFGTSTIGASALVRVACPGVAIDGVWETQQKTKGSIETVSGAQHVRIGGKMLTSGGILIGTDTFGDMQGLHVTDCWDSVNNRLLRVMGGAGANITGASFLCSSKPAGVTGVSSSGMLEGAAFNIQAFDTGINCSGEIALGVGRVAGCTSGIVASGSGVVGPISYSGNTTDETIGGSVITSRTLAASAAYDPPSIAAGAAAQVVVAVPGAAVGDRAQASFTAANAGITWSAEVTSAGSVTATARNVSGAAVDLAAGTLRVKVLK